MLIVLKFAYERDSMLNAIQHNRKEPKSEGVGSPLEFTTLPS